MRLRRLEPGDHDAVRRILLAAYAQHLHAESDYVHELLDLEDRDRGAEVWVAVDGSVGGADDEAVVGTVTLCPPGSSYREVATDDEGEFRMLAVHPERHGEGLGRALSELVVQEFRDRGLAGVALCSTPTMTTAHRLYESLGFVRDPTRDWSPHPVVDLLAYRLDL